MATTLESAKLLLSPPGDTIQEHIDFIGMSRTALAEKMGMPKETIKEVIKGSVPVTADTAVKLEKVLGIPAGFWLNREKTFRKELHELQQKEEKSLHGMNTRYPSQAKRLCGLGTGK